MFDRLPIKTINQAFRASDYGRALIITRTGMMACGAGGLCAVGIAATTNEREERVAFATGAALLFIATFYLWRRQKQLNAQAAGVVFQGQHLDGKRFQMICFDTKRLNGVIPSDIDTVRIDIIGRINDAHLQEALKEASGLRNIQITSCRHSNLTAAFLDALPKQIETLSMAVAPLQDYSRLQHLHHLKRLALFAPLNQTTINSLQLPPTLSRLLVVLADDVTDLGDIVTSSTEFLAIDGRITPELAAQLANMTHLKTLTIASCSQAIRALLEEALTTPVLNVLSTIGE